ncbi:1-deoxy-D-xylulose-5-phosphate reductoisomerase [Olivibacter sitiensis]|uniref:1-deoxy-D-xylulose-5-phosphate reductoisomerase n=1 Tax=Olivibacter sitiensis TaxID=376470 RepID=UPI0003F839E4|nr:1-deoxy-D-xylulose-5-phosphate reductoisomerase [Olivibacter sitiensis]
MYQVTKRRIAILGSTGSIGTQALEVIDAQRECFDVNVLTAATNADLLIEQAKRYMPQVVVIAKDSLYAYVKKQLDAWPIQVLAGCAAMEEVVLRDDVDMVLTAVVGFSGLKPTIAAISAGKDIALANKETLVVAGELIMRLARKHGTRILPVDSEHSAIFQCLSGEKGNPIEKIILTASGGPFRGKDPLFLSSVTKREALKHPNWSMGDKITIDSASLMNKGLEVIEAKWLFDLDADQIDVVVHPQSVVHSLVQFEDGSIKAQLGLPDMKIPIQYALSYPERLKSDFRRFDFKGFPSLGFEEPDKASFRNLDLAYRAMNLGGNIPCALNAANEIVVAAFLKDQIGFLEMSDVIEEVMAKAAFVEQPKLEDYLSTDQWAREWATKLVTKNKILHQTEKNG